MLNSELAPATSNRIIRSLALRTSAAGFDDFAPAPSQIDNGDEARFADKSGTYTKGILQSGIGVVDLSAYGTFKTALSTGHPKDFEKIVLGGQLGNRRLLNGPQGGLAFYLHCLDCSQFHVPPAPALKSEAYAAELIELYWASLLRDVAFTDYATDMTAAKAAAELSSLPDYAGPRNTSNKVTPDLLFRGGRPGGAFPGEAVGPYMSQFLLQRGSLGALQIEQKYMTNQAQVDFMLDPNEFLLVQNGSLPTKSLTPEAPVYLHNGRGLAGLTHNDVLYQEFLTAYLVMSTLNVPPNPGNPYDNSKTQNGFATFGGPDAAATLAAVAAEALKAVWYQKWWVHLRHRPESGGAIVHLLKSGVGGVQGEVSGTVLTSEAVKASFMNNNSYFLSQAFPEGSPMHPAYPTGHGTVAGACITALKFFYDGDYKIPKQAALVSSNNGQTTAAYNAPAGEPELSVNGELHKLAHNVSFGHGLHAGIHWRSDTDTSIELGEAVALSYLRDRARTYNEKFTVSLTKVDGTKTTISNP